jgi:phosphoglycerate dehydrogenase-like enzyme
LEVNATFVPKLEDILAQSDFVIPLCLLNNDTRGMFNETRFSQMKKGSIFINAGRGQLVDQNALIGALRSGHLAAAGLDVTDPEPLPAGHALLDPSLKDRLVIIPHIGSASMATRNKMAEITTANLIAGLKGEAMPHALL